MPVMEPELEEPTIAPDAPVQPDTDRSKRTRERPDTREIPGVVDPDEENEEAA